MPAPPARPRAPPGPPAPHDRISKAGFHSPAALTSLDFEVVVPVRAASMDELPEAGQPVGGEEEQTPAFVLLDMDTLMWTEALQLFPGDGQDDVAENDGTKPKLTRESPTAIGGFAVGELERAASHPRATAKGVRFLDDSTAQRRVRYST